ncbi:ATP-binding protein [Ruania alkalisoli]|uniref:ATP-binding protein n=1 Tax=Ruania alkalisoli TaxID=2779775 RepID=A0A7M1SRJ1_9MICO|nr:DUF4143 domain-containing protein [Ruania alkalisoli]QOR69402.1 ATP-binding protein [Ruania alkalisoli]
MDYGERVIDTVLDEVQPLLRAVSVHGPKGVGKTATASRRARTIFDMSQVGQREIVMADPRVLVRTPGPVLIDEWQRLPEVWEHVRRAVDDGVPNGHFLIAGSSAPRGATVHSGAGRIVPLRMRPLSLAERDLTPPSVSLTRLLDGERELHGTTDVELLEYVEEITASGFPGIRSRPDQVRGIELDGYLENVIQREFPEQGYQVRRPESLRAWLAAYAAATSSTTSYTKILDAATPGLANKPATETTIVYRDALSSLWLIDPVPAWMPGHNHLERLGRASKHQLADPALAARLLGLDARSLLRSDTRRENLVQGTILGALFEHLATMSVHTYAAAAQARVSHLRTNGGRHEVDLIVHRPDGAFVALEVKLSDRVVDSDVRHLHWLREQVGSDMVDAVVLHCGTHAYRRADGVGVVPLVLLGP